MIEDFAFYGELGKRLYQVIHLAGGFVVLEKSYQYPEPFDIEHATIANTAHYFVGNIAVKLVNGRIENDAVKSLPFYDLIGKTST